MIVGGSVGGGSNTATGDNTGQRRDGSEMQGRNPI
jgi:hypothetical protein